MTLNYEALLFDKCIEKIKYKKKINKKKYLKNGKFPIVSQEDQVISGFWNNTEDVYKIDKPVIIFGDHTRVLKYIDFDFVIGADGTKIIKTKPNIIPKYFYYFLFSANIKSLGYSRHYKLLKKLKLNLPPLPIQQKIVAKLDKIFAEIDKASTAAEAYIKNSETLFQAYLENIFNCNKNWTEHKLSQLCENFKQDIVDGPFGSNLKKKDFINEGIPILKIQNIKEGEILKKNINFVIYEKYNSLKRHSFIKGDIVMTKLGNPLGVSAIVNNFDYGLIVADLVRIRAKKINTEFLCYQLNSRKIKNFINSQQKGSTRPRVTLKIIRDLPINIPNKIDHQLHVLKSINDFIKQIKNIIQLSNSKIIELNKLKQSILLQAFNGELVKAA